MSSSGPNTGAMHRMVSSFLEETPRGPARAPRFDAECTEMRGKVLGAWNEGEINRKRCFREKNEWDLMKEKTDPVF